MTEPAEAPANIEYAREANEIFGIAYTYTHSRAIEIISLNLRDICQVVAQAERDRLQVELHRMSQAVHGVAQGDIDTAYQNGLRVGEKRADEQVADLKADLARIESELAVAMQAANVSEAPLREQLAQARAADLNALQAEVNEWGRATFPRATPRSILAHLRRETKELLEMPADLAEAADVTILAMQLCGAHGVQLIDVVRQKMAINRARVWGEPDAEGVVEHVEDRT